MSHVASTGIEVLDRALDGVFWGDNVVWESAGVETVAPFVDAAAACSGDYDGATWVSFDAASAVPSGLSEVIDATPTGRAADPEVLVERLRETCGRSSRQLVMLDSLGHLVARVGTTDTARFFVQACPMMLGLGAVAVWQLPASRPEGMLRRRIAEVTQCILTVADGVLRIEKAEGRRAGVEGSVFRYRIIDGVPELQEAPAAARLGSGLRGLRRDRHLSQAAVARLAGVSPSAISQAERAERGLSLGTLLTLSGRLGITLDDLLRGSEVGPGYRISRRDDPRRDVTDEPVPLLDDPRLGLRAYVLRLRPGGSATPGFAHKGLEVVAVAQGLVQVILATGRPVLRQGETLVAEASGVEGWRNLSEREALAFWILRD